MNKYYQIDDLKANLLQLRNKNLTIGFVPTMGALHQGHVSLIQQAKKECDIVVCSIFVNPTQFNDKSDLEKYPRTLDADIVLLENALCDVLFTPSAEEMYPEPDNRVFDFERLDKVMEGAHRAGHFNGVAQVVSKLFDIVQPHKAYFGQKDFQQLAIVKALVKKLNIGVEIIGCPIIRETDGLAMSSRNVRLSAEERKTAPVIFQTLSKVKELSKKYTVRELKTFVEKEISQNTLLSLDYFEIVDAISLQPIDNITEANEVVACIAVKLGNVRLIDNIILIP